MTTEYLAPATPFASSSNPTPFGTYDSDGAFQSDADSMVVYIRRSLGSATMTVELTERDIWSCFENAVLEFGAYISAYEAKDLLMDKIGTPSGSLSEVKIPHHSVRLLQHYSAPYSHTGDAYTMHSASTKFIGTQQHQDIRAELVAAGKINDNDILRIKEVYYASNVQVYRLFNTTSALNYLNREFNFSSYIPEVMFYLLPVWEDVLRTQEFKVSDRVRRSNFGYRLNNGVLSIYPAPKTEMTIWYQYQVEPYDDIYASDEYKSYLLPSGSVTNVSNMPIYTMPYGSLNAMSRQFVKRITLALSKELLGRVRGKLLSIPIPNSEVTLDGAELRSEAAAELDAIRGELKEWLDTLTHAALLEQEDAKMEANMRLWQKKPMLITKN